MSFVRRVGLAKDSRKRNRCGLHESFAYPLVVLADSLDAGFYEPREAVVANGLKRISDHRDQIRAVLEDEPDLVAIVAIVADEPS